MQWLNAIVDELERRHPDGEILIETGSSPSGTYHLGHMRELVVADAIFLEARRRGRQARHVQFVDDLDGLRKIPVNVPPEYEKHLGYPLCDIPAPDGSDQSYADYFLQTLIDGCAALGIEVEFVRSHQKYRSGFFVPAIERALEGLPKVRRTLEVVSGRQLDDTWSPIQIMEQGRLKKRSLIAIDKNARTLQYKDADGNPQTIAYDKGEVKLDWRLDFPARWWLQHVACEPSGRDHITKGGSVDTGEQICREVYEAEPPLAVPYDFINMVGDTKKMSASKGTGLDATEGSKIMPPEVLRYFIMRSPPLKRLYFDPVNGLMQLMDEFAAFAAKTDKTESEQQLWHICTRGGNEHRSVSRVPFSHLVASYQASLRDARKTLEVIKRTEHAQLATEDADIIREELHFIDAWLEKRAPEDIKFSLQDSVNPADFSEAQKSYFKQLADKIAQAPDGADGEWFHKAIYDLKETSDLSPKELFQSLYHLLIGKPSGPRTGWFLSLLPRDWLLARLRLEDAKPDPAEGQADALTTIAPSAQLTDDARFSIDDAVLEQFPQAAVGYLVADLSAKVTDGGRELLDDAVQTLIQKGVTPDTLSAQPEIAVWREAFKSFGVKPSKYLSSIEALAKRALKDKPAQVSPIVDIYNAISLKNLVSMGAFDLDKLHGDIVVRYGHVGESALLLGIEKPVTVEPAHVIFADEQQVITWLWNHRDAAATTATEATKRAVFFADSLQGPELAGRAIGELAAELQKQGIAIRSQGVVGKSK